MPEPTSLRALDAADLPLVLEWRNHPDIRRHMFSSHPIKPDEHERWYRDAKMDTRQHLFIFEVQGQRLGVMTFQELGSSAVVDWGFYVSPRAPAGTGRQLAYAALSHAFADLRVRKVCGRVLGANHRSIRFHRHLGFIEEGVLREQHFDGAGYQDIFCFGLLNGEWRGER